MLSHVQKPISKKHHPDVLLFRSRPVVEWKQAHCCPQASEYFLTACAIFTWCFVITNTVTTLQLLNGFLMVRAIFIQRFGIIKPIAPTQVNAVNHRSRSWGGTHSVAQWLGQ